MPVTISKSELVMSVTLVLAFLAATVVFSFLFYALFDLLEFTR